jgi:hypothetical protein
VCRCLRVFYVSGTTLDNDMKDLWCDGTRRLGNVSVVVYGCLRRKCADFSTPCRSQHSASLKMDRLGCLSAQKRSSKSFDAFVELRISQIVRN